MARRLIKIVARVKKRNIPDQVGHFLDQHFHQPVEKRHVGDLVDDRRAGRDRPVFDPKVRGAVLVPANNRPGPAPDRAVVQPGVAHLLRGGVKQFGKQHRIALAVGLEHPKQGIFNVTHAEGYALAIIPFADRNRALKQRNARFRPQVPAEQVGRIGGNSDHRRRGDFRGVVIADAVPRPDLQMNLERGRRRLQHDIGMDGFNPVVELQGKLDRLALAQVQDLLVDRLVALGIGHIPGTQVFILQGRQNADHEDFETHFSGGFLGFFPGFLKPFVQPAQPLPGQLFRLAIELDVKQRQFMNHQRVVELFQEFMVFRGRPEMFIDHTGLQLIATVRFGFGKVVFGEPDFQQIGLFTKPPVKFTEILFGES